MTIVFFKVIEFISISMIALIAGIEYGVVIGMALFVALNNLREIKEAVEEGVKK